MGGESEFMKESYFLLVVQVFQEKIVEEVVIALTAIGVKDVFSLSAVDESRRLPYNISIFSGFKGELGRASSLSKTFMAYVQDDEVPSQFLFALKEADIHLVEDDLGSVALIPMHSFYVHSNQKDKK